MLNTRTSELRTKAAPDSPRVLKGGIVLVDSDTTAVRRIILLKCYAHTLTHLLRNSERGSTRWWWRSIGNSAAQRFAIETMKLDAAIGRTIHRGGAS